MTEPTQDAGLTDAAELLRLPPGPVDLTSVDPRSTPGFTGDKAEGKSATAALEDDMVELQTMLFAQGYTGGDRRLLQVLQGMDTSGKGGVIKHAGGLFNPGGLRIK